MLKKQALYLTPIIVILMIVIIITISTDKFDNNLRQINDISNELGVQDSTVGITPNVSVLIYGKDIGKTSGGGFMFDTSKGIPGLIEAMKEREPILKGEAVIELKKGDEIVGYFRSNKTISDLFIENGVKTLYNDLGEVLFTTSDNISIAYENIK